MKTFLNDLTSRRKLELLIWSGVFAIAFCLITVEALENIASNSAPNQSGFVEANKRFLPYLNYFYPLLARYLLTFGGFLLLNFWVLPKFFRANGPAKPGWWLVGSFVVLTVLLTLVYLPYRAYRFSAYGDNGEAVHLLFRDSVLAALSVFLFTGIYAAVKSVTRYVLANAEGLEARYAFVTREGLLAFLAWFVSLLLVILSRPEGGVIIAWCTVGPTGILFYWFALYRLIPSVKGKRRAFLRYLLHSLVTLLFVVLIGAVVLLFFVGRMDPAFAFSFFNGVFQFFVTVPLAWVVYKQKQKGRAELSTLKNALGQRTAHFDFLRSQINPHFLFNALNTIYGTALQENAERTAEGVERLSSMMRFMLQENLQDSIALTREIEYLNNYIALQRLRTAAHPNITLDVAIDDAGAEAFYLAPMLLIPFVENAFKHGISFRSPSSIRISLEVRGTELLFDVFNTRHEKSDNDPEKTSHGIGLKNVQERLQLLYPGQHALSVRETAKQFFIHLTLQLRRP